MARRKKYIRDRSPTPPWLQDWALNSKRVARVDNVSERYNYVPPPHKRKDREERIPRDDPHNSRSTYGPWSKTSSDTGQEASDGPINQTWFNPIEPRKKPLLELPVPGQMPQMNEGLWQGHSEVDDTEIVLDDTVRCMMAQLVGLVRDGNKAGGQSAGSDGGLLQLPFNNIPEKEEEKLSEDFTGDFSQDDISTVTQFTGVNSRALEQKEERRGRGLYCNLCDLGVGGIEQYQKHLLGMKHKKMLKKKGLVDEVGTPSQARINTGLVPQDSDIKIVQCAVCGEECYSNNLAPHITKQSHIAVENQWRLLKKPIPRFVDMFVKRGAVPVVPQQTDTPFCSICEITLSSFEELEKHNKGRKHSKMVTKMDEQQKPQYVCKICNITATSENGLQEHYNGKKHALKVLQGKEGDGSAAAVGATFSCDVCDVLFCTDAELKIHFTKEEHFTNIREKAAVKINTNPSAINPAALVSNPVFASTTHPSVPPTITTTTTTAPGPPPATTTYTMPATANYTKPATANYTKPATANYTANYSVPPVVKYSMPSTVNYSVPATANYTMPATANYTMAATANYSMAATGNYSMAATANYTMPATANYTMPPTTNYSMPAMANYSVPATANYSVPATINYSMPATANYTMPATANYTMPAMANYTMPAMANYSMPATTSVPATVNYSMPATANYTMPATANYSVPATTNYSMPATVNYAIPTTANYTLPAAVNYTTPVSYPSLPQQQYYNYINPYQYQYVTYPQAYQTK